jgi:hypothetical protein
LCAEYILLALEPVLGSDFSPADDAADCRLWCRWRTESPIVSGFCPPLGDLGGDLRSVRLRLDLVVEIDPADGDVVLVVVEEEDRSS